MRGVVLEKAYDVVVYDDLPYPVLQHREDAIVRITRCAICGSDLHPYRGEIASFRQQCVMGHEFAGEVVEIGRGVTGLKAGDLVFGSDLIACGRCEMCRAGLHYHCRHSTLFGYGEVVGAYVAGAQAEYIRVPFADTVLKRIPDGVTEDQAVFASDVLTTAYAGLLRGGFQRGDEVLVIGCGAVGLSVVLCAVALGASRVFAVDPVRARAARAGEFGAIAISDITQVPDAVVAEIGRPNVPRIVEAVGTAPALELAINLAGPRGTVSVVGAHGRPADGFPLNTCFVREVQLSFTVGNPLALAADVLALIQRGLVDPTRIVSHRMELRQAREAYHMFDAAEAIKILLTPA